MHPVLSPASMSCFASIVAAHNLSLCTVRIQSVNVLKYNHPCLQCDCAQLCEGTETAVASAQMLSLATKTCVDLPCLLRTVFVTASHPLSCVDCNTVMLDVVPHAYVCCCKDSCSLCRVIVCTLRFLCMC